MEYLKNLLKRENSSLSDAEIKEILAPCEGFQALYTLTGRDGVGTFADSYMLTDFDGVKIDIDTLCNIDRYTLGKCFNYFCGLQTRTPDYVVEIIGD